MLLKYSAAVAALALCGQANASRCKPDPRSTTTDLETSSTAQTSVTETSSTTIEVSSSTTASLSTESSTSEDTTSSSILTSETSTSASESTTLVVSTTESTTESTTLDTTTTESLSTTTTDASTTTEASTTETSTTTSSAPQCTFTEAYSNYVRNPSFENTDANGEYTADPWTFTQDPVVENSQAKTGQNAIAYHYPDPPYNSVIQQRLLGTVSGHEYVIKYYWSIVQGQPLVSNYCRIGTSAGDLGQDPNYISVDGSQTVQQGQYYAREFRIIASEDDQRMRIGFFCDDTTNGEQVKIHIDDIAVYDYYADCEVP